MATTAISTITALQAQATANDFLCGRLPDRFTAGQPRLDQLRGVWEVPVLLAYPVIGAVGQVGEITVNLLSEEVISHTSLAEMRSAAQSLYQQHRDEIEAPVP